MGKWAYYGVPVYFKHPWQRITFGVSLALVMIAVDQCWSRSLEKRYSLYSGRSGFFADETVNFGWVDKSKKPNTE